jgi:hypothetical protein
LPAVQVQWQSDNDMTHCVLPDQFSQTGEVAPAIDPRPNRKWA